MIMNAE